MVSAAHLWARRYSTHNVRTMRQLRLARAACCWVEYCCRLSSMLFPVNAWLMLFAGHLNVSTMATTSAPAGLHTAAHSPAHPTALDSDKGQDRLDWHMDTQDNDCSARHLQADCGLALRCVRPTWEACL